MRFSLFIPIVALLISACATTPGEGGETAARAEQKPRATTPRVQVSTGKVDLQQGVETLGNTVRKIGEAKAGGIVLMNGMFYETLQPLQWRGRRFDDAVADLAAQVEAKVDSSGGYAFLYPGGYELLTAWNLSGQLPPEAASVTVSAGFGNGTKLSSALAFLSDATGITLLADNAVADSRTGEMWLPPMPLPAVLEALLKSARVPPEHLTVQSTPSLAMFRSRGSRSAAKLLGPAAPALQERVSVYLPQRKEADQRFAMVFQAVPLRDLLPVLSQQMGVPVRAAGALQELPVEQCVFINQPRAVVMEYLIGQWPAPGIGYRWDGEGVVIERY